MAACVVPSAATAADAKGAAGAGIVAQTFIIAVAVFIAIDAIFIACCSLNASLIALFSISFCFSLPSSFKAKRPSSSSFSASSCFVVASSVLSVIC